MAKITIGIPVYNGQDFLEETIISVLQQTYTDFELFISDNDSNDNTRNICEKYLLSDSRVKYIKQASNIGPIKNFSYLINTASSDYFMWLSADDLIDTNWVENLLEISERNNSIAFGVVQYIDNKGDLLTSTANAKRFTFKGPSILKRIKFIYTSWLNGKMILFWGIFPRKKLIGISNEIFNSNWGSAIDTAWIYFCLNQINVCSTSSVKLYKRIHEKSGNAELHTIQITPLKFSFISRLKTVLTSIFKVNMYFDFINSSSFFQNLMIVLSFVFMYPYYIASSLFILLKYKIKNHVRKKVN